MNETKRITVEEAASYVGLAKSTLDKFRCYGSGGPTFLKVSSRRVVYDTRDLDSWLESKRRVSTSDPGDTSVAV